MQERRLPHPCVLHSVVLTLTGSTTASRPFAVDEVHPQDRTGHWAMADLLVALVQVQPSRAEPDLLILQPAHAAAYVCFVFNLVFGLAIQLQQTVAGLAQRPLGPVDEEEAQVGGAATVLIWLDAFLSVERGLLSNAAHQPARCARVITPPSAHTRGCRRRFLCR